MFATEVITGTAIQTARNARPVLHTYVGDELVCGSRAAWIEADDFEALVAESTARGWVCKGCGR